MENVNFENLDNEILFELLNTLEGLNDSLDDLGENEEDE